MKYWQQEGSKFYNFSDFGRIQKVVFKCFEGFGERDFIGVE